MFESKIRRVGTSLGLLIPTEVAKTKRLGEGRRVVVALLEKDSKAIHEAFGSARGAQAFVRDHAERHIR